MTARKTALHRYWIPLTAFTGLVCLLFACHPPSDTEQSASGGQADQIILRRGSMSEAGTLHPHRISLYAEAVILRDLYSLLVMPSAKGTPIPGAAMHWEAGPDKRVWTFHLRNHQWSDGTPVTADDFVFGIRRALDPETAASQIHDLYFIENAREIVAGTLAPEQAGVGARGPNILEFRLAHPVPDLPKLLLDMAGIRAAPLPRHIIEHAPDRWRDPGVMVTNGAYRLTEWRPNTVIRLNRNPHFYDADKVQIDEVRYIPTVDRSAAFRAFRTGLIDLMNGMRPTEYLAWRDRIGDQARLTEINVVQFVAFNLNRSPFDDAPVRRAVDLAIDREVLAGFLRRLGERPAHRFTPGPVDYAGYEPEVMPKPETREERLEEARTLLAQSGFDESRPLRFTLHYVAGGTDEVAIAIRSMLREVGIRAQLLGKDGTSHYADLQSGNFDVAVNGWIGSNDPAALLSHFLSDAGPANFMGFQSPAFDMLFERSRQAVEEQARLLLLSEAESLMLANRPVIPLYFPKEVLLIAPHVNGYHPNPALHGPTRFLRVEREQGAAGPM